MTVDIDVCKNIAIKSGLPLQFVLKEYAVFDVLSQISGKIEEKMAVFKGGTALNKVYLHGVQRFSKDLDFDIGAKSVKDAIDFCTQLKEEIDGYEVSRVYKVGNSAQFYCKYESLLKTIDNVRVDVSAKKMITLNPIRKNTAKSDYCQLFVSGIRVYSLDDLVARKLNALRCRGEGKDFFDVSRSIDMCENLSGALKKLIVDEELKMDCCAYIEECVEKIKKADSKKLMKVANPYIPAGLRPSDWRLLLNDLEYKLNEMD